MGMWSYLIIATILVVQVISGEFDDMNSDRRLSNPQQTKINEIEPNDMIFLDKVLPQMKPKAKKVAKILAELRSDAEKRAETIWDTDQCSDFQQMLTTRIELYYDYLQELVNLNIESDFMPTGLTILVENYNKMVKIQRKYTKGTVLETQKYGSILDSFVITHNLESKVSTKESALESLKSKFERLNKAYDVIISTSNGMSTKQEIGKMIELICCRNKKKTGELSQCCSEWVGTCTSVDTITPIVFFVE